MYPIQYQVKHLKKSMYPIKCPYEMKPEFIVVHNTSNVASAANEISYMTTNLNEVSFHIAVDDKGAIEGIPLNRNAWACGDGSKGSGNRKGIQVEICYSANNHHLFDKAEENAIKLIAFMLKDRGWGVEKVKKHQDFSRKYCPHRTLDRGWNRFLELVEKEMLTMIDKEINDESHCTNGSFLIRVTCDELNIRQSHSFSSPVVGVVKRGEVFTIVEVQGQLGKLKSGKGWISLNAPYVEKLK